MSRYHILINYDRRKLYEDSSRLYEGDSMLFTRDSQLISRLYDSAAKIADKYGMGREGMKFYPQNVIDWICDRERLRAFVFDSNSLDKVLGFEFEVRSAMVEGRPLIDSVEHHYFEDPEGDHQVF